MKPRKCSICGEPAVFDLVRRATGVPLVVFGKRLEDPVFLCSSHGVELSNAGAVVTRRESPLERADDGMGGRASVALLVVLAALLVGCSGFGRAVDDLLPDRFGVGHTRGELEGWDSDGYEMEPDRDLRLMNFYVEWDVPQITYEPPRRDLEDARMDREILTAILDELRAMNSRKP
jgi:hypothetical protein